MLPFRYLVPEIRNNFRYDRIVNERQRKRFVTKKYTR